MENTPSQKKYVDFGLLYFFFVDAFLLRIVGGGGGGMIPDCLEELDEQKLKFAFFYWR